MRHDAILTPMAREAHPVDLMCLYLLHGSVERVPGLLTRPDALSFTYLCRHAGPGDRWTYADTDTFSLAVDTKVRGRRYGLEFRIAFIAGEPYADAVIPFGARIGLRRFLRHLRANHIAGEWDYTVYTDAGDLRESVLLSVGHCEVWFTAEKGRLITGRLQGNRFGTGAPVLTAGGTIFPDRAESIGGASPAARAYRRRLAGLRDPLPLRAGRRARSAFGARTR